MTENAPRSGIFRKVQFGIWLALVVTVMLNAKAAALSGGLQALLIMLGAWLGYTLIARFGSPEAKPWLYLAGGSVMLFALLVVAVALAGGEVLMGAISWVVITALSAWLLWFYRKTGAGLK